MGILQRGLQSKRDKNQSEKNRLMIDGSLATMSREKISAHLFFFLTFFLSFFFFGGGGGWVVRGVFFKGGYKV